MHVLYLDDSGSADNPKEQHLVLGGISVYEAQAYWFTQELDRIAIAIDANDPNSVEFHASEVFGGRSPPWNSLKSKDERIGVIKAVLRTVADAYDSARAFACVVHKASFPGRDPMEIAFEDLCSRFDLYLTRLHAMGDRQRGLIILDQSSYETSLQNMAKNFRSFGTRWNAIRNLADTPVFINSKASRLVQLADHIAYAVFRRYEASDASYIDIIAHRFDEDDGRVHGLVHLHKTQTNCRCLACMSKKMSRP